MIKLFYFLKLFITAKWIFKYPVKKDILLYDGIKNPFKNNINKKKFNIYYRRGEQINIPILAQCFFFYKFSPSDYLEKYLQYMV